MRRSRRKTKNGGETMEENKKINVGVVLSTTLENWRDLQVLLSKKADIVFVKKVPHPHKLKISEVIGEEGEKYGENGEFDSSDYSNS
jgi:hypothetical protein